MNKEYKTLTTEEYKKLFEETVSFINDNIAIINNAFSEKCGCDVSFTVTLEKYKACVGGHLIRLNSNSVMSGFGRLAPMMFKNIYIEMFASPMLNDYNEVIGFTMNPSFRYSHPQGGMNGSGDACCFKSVRIMGGDILFEEVELCVGEVSNFCEDTYELIPSEEFDKVDKLYNDHKVNQIITEIPKNNGGWVFRAHRDFELVTKTRNLSIYRVKRDDRITYFKVITI